MWGCEAEAAGVPTQSWRLEAHLLCSFQLCEAVNPLFCLRRSELGLLVLINKSPRGTTSVSLRVPPMFCEVLGTSSLFAHLIIPSAWDGIKNTLSFF